MYPPILSSVLVLNTDATFVTVYFCWGGGGANESGPYVYCTYIAIYCLFLPHTLVGFVRFSRSSLYFALIGWNPTDFSQSEQSLFFSYKATIIYSCLLNLGIESCTVQVLYNSSGCKSNKLQNPPRPPFYVFG